MTTEENAATNVVAKDSGGSAPAPSGANPIRFVVWAAVAIAFTCFVLQYSLRHNRLAYFPTQDDVAYICDGLDRLNVFYAQGTAGSYYYYRVLPPRSPVGTYMA